MFNIDFLPSKKTVVCNLEGHTTSDELSKAIFLLVNDERYKEDYHCIWDIRNVPDFSFFLADSNVYAKIIASFRKVRKGKLVIIAHDAMSCPVFAKFHDEITQEGIQLDQHKTLEQAFNWLRSQN